MESEQNGTRIQSLNAIVEDITSVYDLANPSGIRSIEFVNRATGLWHVRSEDWRKESSGVQYDGMSRIGTALKLKILDQYVWKNKMTKPLLVIIITDGDVSLWKPDKLYSGHLPFIQGGGRAGRVVGTYSLQLRL